MILKYKKIGERLCNYQKSNLKINMKRINKIIISGSIDKEAWAQLNKTFITNPSKEIYT